DCDARYYELSLGEGRQLVKHPAAGALHGLGYGVLVDRVDYSHNELGHALGQHVRVQLPGPLSDQSDPDAELSAFGQNLLQHIGRYHGLAGGRESMRFFEQHENGIWQISLVGRIGYFPLVSCHSSEYGAPQQGPHNDLLLVLIYVDKLEHGTLARLEQV